MLPISKLKLIQDLVANSSKEELIWLNGYLAGILSQSQIPGTDSFANLSSSIEKTVQGKMTIAYGTETGNSKKLAIDFASKAKKNGINAKLVSLEQYRLNDLPKEEYFFTVISTQGEGDPPDAAKKFYDHIHQNGFELSKLKYGVLALGDTAYPLFCKAGEDIDAQLHKLGGERFVSLQKCDTDYESEAVNWFSQVLGKMNNREVSGPASPVIIAKKTKGKKIYQGTVLANINLNDFGSNKETRHIEITTKDPDYQPGDSIGIIPENRAETVASIIALANADPDKETVYRNEEISLSNLLKKRLNVVYLSERVVKKYAAIVCQEIPETKIGLLDLLKIYPIKNSKQFEEVVSCLEPIAPRLYSISSSPEAHPGEIHLTVAKDSFTINEEVKYGLCSDLLCQLGPEATIDFYVHSNSLFKLPAPDKDIIMIGPGTGLAPFRSFLSERDSSGAIGRNWLFYGDQHFQTDFLYQTEIQNWAMTGVLTKITVAFSRDQDKKVYVQHKMMKHGAELFEWLQKGAFFYICGAKDPMSIDVEKTLVEIVKAFGKKKEPDALAYLDELKQAGRFLKDVY